MRSLFMGMIAAVTLSSAPAGATILTFDADGTVSNFENIGQDYGDRVTATNSGGMLYGVGVEGFTPNVVTSYGTPGEDPALWTTGYGNLTNIYFNDADFDTTMTLTLTADAGFDVLLHGFDLASYISPSLTISSLTITDLSTATILFSQSATVITATTHNSFDFATPLTGNNLQIVVGLVGLGGVSDDIGMDNVRFGQAATAAVPEPASWAMMIGGFGLLGGTLRRRPRGTLRLA